MDPAWNLGSLLTGHAVLGHPDLELANVTTKHRVWARPSATLVTLVSTWPSAFRTSSGLAQGGRLKPKGLDRNVTFAQDDWPGSARYHGRPIGQWVGGPLPSCLGPPLKESTTASAAPPEKYPYQPIRSPRQRGRTTDPRELDQMKGGSGLLQALESIRRSLYRSIHPGSLPV